MTFKILHPRVARVTYVASNDAIEQGVLLCNMLAERRRENIKIRDENR